MGQVKPTPGIVAKCVPRQDGGFMVITRKGLSATSPTEIPEGSHVVISGGRAERLAR